VTTRTFFFGHLLPFLNFLAKKNIPIYRSSESVVLFYTGFVFAMNYHLTFIEQLDFFPFLPSLFFAVIHQALH